MQNSNGQPGDTRVYRNDKMHQNHESWDTMDLGFLGGGVPLSLLALLEADPPASGQPGTIPPSSCLIPARTLQLGS